MVAEQPKEPDSQLLERSDVVLIVGPDGPIIILKDRYGGTTANGQVTEDGRVYVFIRNEVS